MNIEVNDIDGTQVVSIDGKIDSNSAPLLDAQLNELLSQSQAKILTDFELTTFISSAGLRVLLSAAKKAKSQGGELTVCSMNPTVSEIFAISGFATILRVFSNREEALAG